MSTFSEFLAMGGYAFYVWSAYAIWGAVMIANAALALARDRAVRRELERSGARRAARGATR